MKIAYHRAILPSGRIIAGPVVIELGTTGGFAGYHLLQGEEENCLWQGGSYHIPIEITKNHL